MIPARGPQTTRIAAQPCAQQRWHGGIVVVVVLVLVVVVVE